MAGETIKSEAICLSVTPWSKTSHVVTWLTPSGRVGTVVKGAVRPKSAFLGQYDLNYTCEIVYYVRAKGELHALRECAPLDRRDALRDDYASLVLAGYFRFLVDRFAPQGPDCADWYAVLSAALDALVADCAGSQRGRDIPVACPEGDHLIPLLLKVELRILHLLGLDPEIEAESGAFVLRGERKIPVSPEVAAYLRSHATATQSLSHPATQPLSHLATSPLSHPATSPLSHLATSPLSHPATSPLSHLPSPLPLDAARALGVYYDFHVDGVSDVRRAVLRLIHNKRDELR